MAQGLQARGWPPRQIHPQEARRQGAAGFQDQKMPQDRNQARRGQATADEDGRQDPHRVQGNMHGGGKGNSQGRGNGRRGKGSKGKPRQAAQQTQPRSEQQRQYRARRAVRAADRFAVAGGQIESVGNDARSEQLQEAQDRARDPVCTIAEEDN